MAEKVMLIDTHKCVACRGCQVACKDWNQLPASNTRFRGTYTNPPTLQANTWTHIRFNEADDGKWLFAKLGCMHCDDAACIKLCPVEAVKRSSDGSVYHDPAECVGCGLCVDKCPFGVPQVSRYTNKMGKCTGCVDRVQNGLQPACVAACPNGTLSFGDREQMIERGQQRVEQLKQQGYSQARLYGLEELDGLHRLYILTRSPQSYSLPESPRYSASVWFWQTAMVPLRKLATIGLFSGALVGLLQLRNRGSRLDAQEQEKRENTI